ncbi:zinc finger protein 260-like [Nothobranchius furzeri]|uniref:zinc finger protein 260-like n=1 Tax=Nothobranchius furzeri TaxID=105023 RepID=UPI0039048DCC
MSSAQSLREFIRERLTAAAAEIFSEFEQTIVRYEEEIDRQRRLLEISWKPQINLHRIELPLHDVSKDEEVLTDQQLWNQKRTSSLDQEQPEPVREGPEPLQMKVEQDDPEPLQILEQDELCMSQDEEQLVLKQETVTSLVTPADEDRDHHGPEPDRHQLLLSLFPEAETRAAAPPGSTVSRKREETDEKPLLLHFHNHQMKDGGVPTSSLAGQMTAKVGGGAETIKNLNLDPNEKTSDSSEIEVSGEDEDDVNLDSERSDSGPETGNGDHGCNENKSSESDIKTINKSFSCPVCGIRFLHKWSLQEHVRVTSHSAVKSSECSVNTKCVKEKQRGGSCRKVQKQPKSIRYEDCGKRFSLKSKLTYHMKGHTGDKPFACKLCGKKFSRKHSLKTHMRVHTGEKPFACELCGKRFGHKNVLNKHITVHTGEKPFACDVCGQRFSRKAYLNGHMRVHTGEKPFACELCGQTYTRKHNLNRHMRVHTGERPLPVSCVDKDLAERQI